MNFVPKGVLPAMITPLTKEGKINEKALRKLVNYLIDGGIHGIFAVGTTGEFYGLTPEEHREVLEITVDETKGRVPVYAGAAAITTKQVVKLVNIAEEVGVDAVSVLTPMFISPSQDQLITHYKTIAANTKLPILLYNNVPKTGVTITAATAAKLADVENIVGIKDSSGDFTLTGEYIRLTRGKNFHVLAGRDTLIHAALCYGGTGSIAACANVAPRLCADIYDKYMAGDIKGSLEAQYTLAPLRIGFTLGTFPTVIKEALELLGIEAGPCMDPVGPMSTEEKEQLKKILIQMGLLK
ncbi:MAG: 4-hydroxy-tetrahydrodipicolinate synthase [Petroclostridium sp.]|jgi:4-hydroxy-tetrahydrodipicolinate synthase|uniref:4-hydroxy-tetrahydrodipicolinate synthase n=1 Tax=Petroclostridium xylanilyticum TaxID=1792311 RepID=UPI0018E345A3|nr:4-hydroxy-tetrahydrodipicolinate synthase [Petroclostridium xylanilyticum]MBZ4646214.1 Dihydrodipicolinate synthase [Clostridia bacterium]MDK2811410.1 4-hydroxy-tetrahydrodipicolinate synthase [Petroclostridium sp.]